MDSTEQIMHSTEQIVASTQQIMASTEQIMASTEQIMASTEQIKASTEQIMASTEQIIDSTEQIIDSTEVPMSTTVNPVPEPIIEPNHSVQVSPTLCPWSKIATETVSLNDIMREQLDKSSQETDKSSQETDKSSQETDKSSQETDNVLQNVCDDNLINSGEEIDDCSNDFLISQILQLQFYKEHDNALKQEEFKYNSSHKVKISYANYLLHPDANSSDDDNDYSSDSDYLEENDQIYRKKIYNAEKGGVYHQGNTTTTKHGPTVCGRRNAGKMLELPPSITTGDGNMFDMKISNNVFSTLKSYSMAKDKKRNY